jgi:Tfp pilus assembly protein PilF
MDPAQVDALWRLARLYQVEGERAEAEAEFTKARSLHERQYENLMQKMKPAGGAAPPQ